MTMKKCRRCSKPATLHITEIRDGQAVALHLCETCAREYLEASDESTPSASSTDLASKLEELVSEGSEEVLASLTCPHCGMTFSEFREKGRFGCPGDYSEFAAQILPLLENIHEDTTHVGKRPRSRNRTTPNYSQLIQLRKQLQEAVECEDYETAARLRDDIASMEATVRSQSAEPQASQPSSATDAKSGESAPPDKPPSSRRRRSKPE